MSGLKITYKIGNTGKYSETPRLITRILKVAKGSDGLPGDRNPRVQSIASQSVINPDIENYDMVAVLNLGEACFFGSPGAAPEEQRLTLRIKDNGTSRALSFDGAYRGVAIPLPTATVPGQVLYLGFLYNVLDDKWDLLAAVPPY